MNNQPNNQPACPEDCPNRISVHEAIADQKIQRLGIVAAIIVSTLVLAAWTARGVIERRSPSTFEVCFAGLSACTLLLDPKSAGKIAGKTAQRFLSSQE